MSSFPPDTSGRSTIPAAMHDDVPTIIESLHATPRPRAQRFIVLYAALAITAAVLLSRSFYLQVLHGGSLRAEAEGNRVAITAIPAPRGIIYDQYHTQLTENVASTDLVIDPLVTPSEEFETPLIELLPQYVPITPTDIQAGLATTRSTRREVVLAKALDHDTVLKLQEALPKLPGIRLSSSLVRHYPYQESSAHVLGYTSPITAEELAAGEASPIDSTGKTGLEKQYEPILRGRHGTSLVEVNAAGLPQKNLEQHAAQAGAALELTLDIELQAAVAKQFQVLAAKAEAGKAPPAAGAVVAIDPRTGAIRALVSYPSFNPNVFSEPAQRAVSTELFTAANQPLFNRASDGTYPPGSTIKPLLAAAALEEKIITSESTVLSTGGLHVGPWNFPDWKSGGHGLTGLRKAIAESVNTFFYLAVGGDATHDGLGVARTTDYLAEFNWGNPTGVDLPSEAAGFLPSPDWKEKTKHERWYIGDTYHLAIGQGDVIVSPLQVAAATVPFANGQSWYEPYLVHSITVPERVATVTEIVAHRLPVSKQNVALVRDSLRATVLEGSGRNLADLPIALAGKTGTAQIGGVEDTHAWFTSFGPFESPELVLTVLLEKGGEGDKDAVPFAKEIWRWWIEHRHKK